MSLAHRIIPCLDTDGERVVKGVNFVGLRDAGDPVALAARYNAEGADELVVLDIAASRDRRPTFLETIRRVGKTEGLEVRGGEFPEVRALGEEYGEAAVSVNFECRIEQLVNFLAALTKEPELLATNEVRVSSGNPKEKTVGVRLTLAGVVPRNLVPVKKGLLSF